MWGTSWKRPHLTDMIRPPCQEMCSHRRRGRAQQLDAAIRQTVRGSQRRVEQGKEGGLRRPVSLTQLNYLNAVSKATTLATKDTGSETKLIPQNTSVYGWCLGWKTGTLQGLGPIFKHWTLWNTSYLFQNELLSLKAVQFLRNVLVKLPAVQWWSAISWNSTFLHLTIAKML